MKKTSKSIKESYPAKKGFGSVSLLLLLSILTSSFLLLQMRLQTLIQWKKEDHLLEKIEIQLVRHLKDKLAEYETEPEQVEMQGISIEITYYENEAYADIYTSPMRQLHVMYDDVWMCIAGFEYLNS